MLVPDKIQVQHLTYREGLSTVFESQVLIPLAYLSRTGIDVNVAVFAPVGNLIRPNQQGRIKRLRDQVLSRTRNKLSLLPSPPSRLRRLWSESLLLKWFLWRRFGKGKSFIAHCRGTEMSRIALNLRSFLPNMRVIYDCRGLEHAERLYQAGYCDQEQAPDELKRASANLRESQKCVAQGADAIISVSNAMKRYLADEFGVPEEKVSVVPCCIDSNLSPDTAIRHEMRRVLKVEGAFVVTYCGSLFEWQCPMECLRLFKLIQMIVPQAHFLAITPSVDKMRNLARTQGVEGSHFTAISAPHSEVFRYLSAGDLGLLIRRDNLVNRVASPVKYGEYLACGIPVLMTEGIGDFSALTRAEGTGVVLPEEASDQDILVALQKFLKQSSGNVEAIRDLCRATAMRHLSYALHIQQIRACYENLMN